MNQVRVVKTCCWLMLWLMLMAWAQHCADAPKASAQDSTADGQLVGSAKAETGNAVVLDAVAGHGRDDRHSVRADDLHAGAAAQTPGAVDETAPPRANLSVSPALIAARVCWLEAEWSHWDCAGMIWAAAKASHSEIGSEAWLRQLISYSYGALHVGSNRARWAIVLPWGDVAQMTPAWNRKWSDLRWFVVDVMVGKIGDPCPSALHFGSKEDGSHGRMVPARCSKKTSNIFYAVRRR